MDEAARKELLRIARDAVAAAVRHETPPRVNPVAPELNTPRGAFARRGKAGALSVNSSWRAAARCDDRAGGGCIAGRR